MYIAEAFHGLQPTLNLFAQPKQLFFVIKIYKMRVCLHLLELGDSQFENLTIIDSLLYIRALRR